MKFYQKLDGGVHVSAREYDVAYNTAITEGQLVKLSEGLVVSAAANETGAVLGVAAENHSGAADVLDPRERHEAPRHRRSRHRLPLCRARGDRLRRQRDHAGVCRGAVLRRGRL